MMLVVIDLSCQYFRDVVSKIKGFYMFISVKGKDFGRFFGLFILMCLIQKINQIVNYMFIVEFL